MPTETPDLYAKPEAMGDEQIMIRQEAARSRDPEFRAMMCRGYVLGYGWYNTQSSQWNRSHNRPTAAVTVAEAIQLFGDGSFLYIEYPPEDPTKPRRRCKFSSLVGTEVDSLIKLSPNNATFRARLMAALGEPPPKEMDTYEKLVDWVEFTFPRSKAAAKKKPVETYSVEYRGEEVTTGRCVFRKKEIIRGTFTLSNATIEQLVDSCSDFGELMDEVNQKIRDGAEQNGNRTLDFEETSDHEIRDSDGLDLDYSTQDLKTWVRKIVLAKVPEGDREDYGLE